MARSKSFNKRCSIDGCDKLLYAKGYCSAHYTRLRNHGDPNRGGPLKISKGEALDFLLNRVVGYDGEDCLTWPYGKDQDGYGKVHVKGRGTLRAHRYVCELVHGHPPTPEHETAHSCGKGRDGCVHPRHLRWATSAENHEDQKTHGTTMFGVKNNRAKLNGEDVIRIRELNNRVSAKKLSADYGVSRQLIYLIWRRKIWIHI